MLVSNSVTYCSFFSGVPWVLVPDCDDSLMPNPPYISHPPSLFGHILFVKRHLYWSALLRLTASHKSRWFLNVGNVEIFRIPPPCQFEVYVLILNWWGQMDSSHLLMPPSRLAFANYSKVALRGGADDHAHV